MKTYFLLMFPLFCFCQNNISDLKKENLYGKVKQIEENIFSAYKRNDTIPADTNRNSKISKFNAKGNYIEMIISNMNTNQNNKTISIYDGNKHLINSKSYKKDTLVNEIVSTYNSKGQFVESHTYKPDGSLFQKVKVKYDKKGRQTEWITYTSEFTKYKKGKPIKITNADTNHVSGQIWKYDDKGVQVEYKAYTDDSLTDSDKLSYTTKKNIIYSTASHIQKILDNDPEITIDSSVFVKNKKGSWTKTYHYKYKYGKVHLLNGKTILESVDSILYDKKGKLVEETKTIYHHKKKSPTTIDVVQTKYTYIKNFNTEIFRFKNGELDYKQTTTIDKKGRVLGSSTFTKKDSAFSKTTTIYDTQGTIIETTSWYKKEKNKEEMSSSIKWLYEYDKKGNWIKKTQLNFLNSIQTGITVSTREITYFK